MEVLEFMNVFESLGNNDFRNQIFSIVKPVERTIVKQTKITKYPVVHLIIIEILGNPF